MYCEPAFFGPKGRLFGVYHPAAGVRRDVGVVVCPPIGQEHVRSYRALALLSHRLADLGCDVLRFDYLGVGDSEGACSDGSWSGWVNDVEIAATELRRGARPRTMVFVGLRIGALLAAAAAESNGGVQALALWKPITDGAAFLDASRQAQRRWLEGSFAPRHLPSEDEIAGFPWPRSVVDHLSRYRWTHSFAGGLERALVVYEGPAEGDVVTSDLSRGSATVAARRAVGSEGWPSVVAAEASGGLVPDEELWLIARWAAGEDHA